MQHAEQNSTLKAMLSCAVATQESLSSDVLTATGVNSSKRLGCSCVRCSSTSAPRRKGRVAVWLGNAEGTWICNVRASLQPLRNLQWIHGFVELLFTTPCRAEDRCGHNSKVAGARSSKQQSRRSLRVQPSQPASYCCRVSSAGSQHTHGNWCRTSPDTRHIKPHHVTQGSIPASEVFGEGPQSIG